VRLRYIEKYGRAGGSTDANIIRCMRFACWITKATNTHSERVILTAFPRQQWLREGASMLTFIRIVRVLFPVFTAMALHDDKAALFIRMCIK
jgi:hypothetical protein